MVLAQPPPQKKIKYDFHLIFNLIFTLIHKVQVIENLTHLFATNLNFQMLIDHINKFIKGLHYLVAKIWIGIRQLVFRAKDSIPFFTVLKQNTTANSPVYLLMRNYLL